MVGFKHLAGLVAAMACAVGSVTCTPSALADPPANPPLINSLPGGFGPNNCKTFNSPFAGAAEAVTCDQNDDLAGPAGGQFFTFGNIKDLATAYKALLAGTTTAPCGQNWPSGSGTWNYGNDAANVNRGDIFCGNDKKNPSLAVLNWTLTSRLALGSISGSDIPSLLQYWQSNGFVDPSLPPAAGSKVAVAPPQ